MTYSPGGHQGYSDPFDDPFETTPTPKKSPWPMISALALVVALVAAGVIYTLFFKDSASTSALNTTTQAASTKASEEATKVAATVIETVTPTEEEKGEKDKDKDRDKEEKDKPALTPTQEAVAGLNKEHNRLTPPDRVRHQELPPTPVPTTPWVDQKVAHMIPLDYRSGWPESISEYHVSNMFDISPSDEDFESRFNRLNPEELSKPLLQEGFKPWWPADGPAHTDKFLELQSQPRASIFAHRELLDSYRIANDVMVYHWRVEPLVSGGINDGEELPPFEVKVAMIGTQDGLWLLDDYWFPEGKEPSIH